LFTKIEKSIKTLKAANPDNILIIFDNLNILTNACYHKNELEIIEIFNEIVTLPEKFQDPSILIALGINRDLFDTEN
jgi:hypothetical protein